jgi:3-isopropylmalate/(R)-2-methylmalate dehydratase small subunit
LPEPLVRIASGAVLLPYDNIDTDRIIPARYLKAVTRDGLAEGLFADWRRAADGSLRPDFPLNDPSSAGRRILVAGHNFGSGSSREHAVWALAANGFRVVIAASFADIFRGNAIKNGLLPLELDERSLGDLQETLAARPDAVVEVDLERGEVRLPGGEVAAFEIDPFARRMLLEGTDELAYLQAHLPEVEAWEASHGASVSTLSPRAAS